MPVESDYRGWCRIEEEAKRLPIGQGDPEMKNYTIATLAAGAMTAAVLGLSGIATAAPSGPSQVDDTVRTLQSSGYDVIVNRTGAAPLSSCTVSSVRQGPTHSTVDSRGGGSPKETILAKTVYIDIAC
jgi:hypothetical protein